MKKILPCSLALVTLVLLLSTCKSDDEFIPPIADVDTTLTDSERMQVFEACKKKSAELNNLKSLEDRVSFLAWLQTQSAFYSSGFLGEDLYAVFQDGRVVLFVNTPPDEPLGGRVSSGRASKPPTTSSMVGRTKDVPKSKKVSLFSGMGNWFPRKAESIKRIFDEADAGFDAKLKDATIANLKAVSGDAVFYIHAHGGAGQLHKKTGAQSIMALWTKELVTDALDLTYKDDLDNERICYMFATYDTEAAEFHYAFTSQFVREYMSFGENCFIYIQACNSFNETVLGNANFRERMIESATNEKATYVGWTGPQADILSGMFVFDRLLGANSGGNISQETPFQRPFDIAQVFADMRSEGLGVHNGAQLMYKTTMEEEVLLRPSIETMDIDEYTSTLTIKGLFPWDVGSVGVDNVAAVVTSWNPYEITCIIPETGDGSVGDVVVVSAQGVESNKVPLTEYIIPLNYSSDDNGVKLQGVCKLRLRADVHLRRSKINETATKPTYPDFSPVSGRPFNVKGSSATYSVSGHKYDVCQMPPCRVQFTESPKPGSGTLQYTLPTPGQTPKLFAVYNWGPEMKTIKLTYLILNVTDIPDVVEERINCPQGPPVTVPVEQSYAIWFGFPTTKVAGTITLDVAENYNIRPDSWNRSFSTAWSQCNNTGSYKLHAQWDFVRPNHAPTEETSGREANGN